MKFKILLLLFLTSCIPTSNNSNIQLFESKGFAYIYDPLDVSKKIVNKKFDNEKLEIGHNILKVGSRVKILNTYNKEFIILRVTKKTKYPVFYKILITKKVAAKLNLDEKFPLIEIQEIKFNKSFIAKKAVTHKDEQRVSNSAPVDKVKIDNISAEKETKIQKKKSFSIIIAEFYSKESAVFLSTRLKKELFTINPKSFKIIKKNNNYELSAGPYNTIKYLKNDYIELYNAGFEELDLKIYE